MKITMNKKLMTFLIFGLLGCDKEDNTLNLKQTFAYDFATSDEGFSGGFADWHDDHPNHQENYNLIFDHASLPDPLNVQKKALKLAGTNNSDDLFMFVKKKLSGLMPNTEYELTFEIEMASNAPTGSFGIGGAVDDVTVKVGATVIEPVSEYSQSTKYYRMNIDHGEQSNGGRDMYAIGKIGVAENTTQYTLITRNNNDNPFKIKTDGSGEMWICIATDSGFEGRTEIYFNKVEVTLE
jgi:hypothetical protein